MGADLRYPVGVTSPSLVDHIEIDGKRVDLTGVLQAKFRMREVTSAITKIDANGIPHADQNLHKGEIRYDWAAGDLTPAGEYAFWWFLELADGRVLETLEQRIYVDEHSPGVGVTFGVIADRARAHLPITFDALSRDSKFGDRRIQDTVEAVKSRVFSTTVVATAEISLHRLVREYLAKLVALALIPPGMDYWQRQHSQISTGRDPVEIETFPDAIKTLGEIQDRLLAETRMDEKIVLPLIDSPLLPSSVDGPAIDEFNYARVTADPRDHISFEDQRRGYTCPGDTTLKRWP